MNTSKKIISLLMCMLMVLTMVQIIPGAMTAHAESSEALTYKISVGGGTADKTEAKAGEVITITATTPSNCRFCGWSTSDVELSDVNATTTTFVMPAKNVSIKANNLPFFSVIVNSGSADKTSAIAKETVTVTANAPTDGMKFVGWTSENDDTYTEVKFADVRATTTTFTMPAGRVKVIANYEPIGDTSYVVTVINGTSSKYIAKAGEEITIKADEKYRKQFIGWTANGIEIPDPTNATVTFVMPTNDVQVEANYVDAYLISVTNGSADKKQAGKDEIITITAKEPDEGTQFAGWTSTSGVVFEDASALTTTFVMLEKDVTVKANYEGIPVNPSYKISVGGGTADKTEAKAGEVVTITATTPTNCRFCGWLTSDVELTDVNATTTTFVMPAKNVSVKANNLPVFIVSVNSGSADKTSAIAKETVTVTANAPADGMEFVEWTTEDGVVFADSKAMTTTFTMPAYSVHIVATYCAHTYDNACDATCNKCETVRTPSAHTGGTATCTAKAKCSVCGTEYGELSTVHVYDNACDAECNLCNAPRTATHTYDNACDTTCNKCGETRTVPAHIGGTATCTEKAKCSVCGEAYGSVNKDNHKSITTLKAVAATYESDGKTEGKKCTACGEITVAQQTVAKKVLGKVTGLKTKAVKLASGTKTTLSLAWTKVADAEKYEVYQQNGKKWKKVGTTAKTTLTVKKLKANKSYKFRVRAIRADAQGAYSSVFTGKTVPLTPSVTLKAGKKALTASWKTVANITGYEVTYSTSKKFTKKTTQTVTIKKAKTKKTTIKKLSKGKKYYVKVRAYKTVGSKKIYSAWSSVKNVKVK